MKNLCNNFVALKSLYIFAFTKALHGGYRWGAYVMNGKRDYI